MPDGSPTPGQPTVLLVDDEEDLRDIMRRTLERRGFHTLTAGDPAEAIDICRGHDGHIDLLLADLTLPGMSGGDLARAAADIRPAMRVVYVSGLPSEVAVDKGLIGPDARLVTKPFTSDVLVRTLWDALADHPARIA